MLKLAILVNLLTIVLASDQVPFETVYEWKFPNYNWPSIDHLMKALNSGEYIPKNNVIFGIKIWRDKMYLTIPRVKNGVPVTLATIPATPSYGITNPLLNPFPSWEMQTEGNCSAFQFVQSMEIDPLGRMWVIDTGRTETMSGKPVTICPPRLVILDLENGGAILRNYVFPDHVAPYNSVVLNDIVVDHQDGGTAFITDSEDADPGLIVYSLKENVSWKFRNNNDSTGIQAEALDGIALSPPGPDRILYYSPLASLHVYSIPVSILRNSSLKNIDPYITDLGVRNSRSGGMMMSNQGVLYIGLHDEDSIAMWDTKSCLSLTDGLTVIFKNHTLDQWPDTFAFDQEGHLLLVSNRLQEFLAGTVDITQTNYRILSGDVQAKSYQYRRDGTSPKLPAIAGDANEWGGFRHCTSDL